MAGGITGRDLLALGRDGALGFCTVDARCLDLFLCAHGSSLANHRPARRSYDGGGRGETGFRLDCVEKTERNKVDLAVMRQGIAGSVRLHELARRLINGRPLRMTNKKLFPLPSP